MSYWSGGYYDWAPRKSAAERRADAARAIKDAARRGKAMSPVSVDGRKIAHTFWGKAWCDNLERYRDFAYRLERGRSYLRSGSVIDLKIEAGKIAAKVSGSSLYDIAIEIDAVKRDAWRAIQRDCAGGIGSRIDLLGGKLSEPVMVRLCADRTGLFPHPSAIRFTCSCPDYATMCKHVAAAMYGVGARLDHAPELLFTLRRVSLDELLAAAVSELPANPSKGRVLAAEGLASLFGIELADPAVPPAEAKRSKARVRSTTPAPTKAAPRATQAAPTKATLRATKAAPKPSKPVRNARTAAPRATTVVPSATELVRHAMKAVWDATKATATRDAAKAKKAVRGAMDATLDAARHVRKAAPSTSKPRRPPGPSARPETQLASGVRGRAK